MLQFTELYSERRSVALLTVSVQLSGLRTHRKHQGQIQVAALVGGLFVIRTVRGDVTKQTCRKQTCRSPRYMSVVERTTDLIRKCRHFRFDSSRTLGRSFWGRLIVLSHCGSGANC